MNTINRLESRVRSYCRSFPAVFTRARGATLYDDQGRSYIDFFAGAGALNYGHNNPVLRERLLDYVASDGVVHGLDMATRAKTAFLSTLERLILGPRDLEYRVMFPGPTGTNAVEAALKLARKVTGRHSVIAFTNGFHGMTLGSLALTGNQEKRDAAGVPLGAVDRMPFDGYFGSDVDTIEYVATMLADPSSGIAAPAAFVVETVQAEGGINVASSAWLQRLERLAREHEALLIIDDIQVGCGRTGRFFSFEDAAITPDIVCLSKSLSGYGLPMSVVLIRPHLDVWRPGEHNGTFRGNNLAFVTATAAMETYWDDERLTDEVLAKAATIRQRLQALCRRFPGRVRGRGLIQGLAFPDQPALATAVSRRAFTRRLIIETAGPSDEVIKLLPPLTIDDGTLARGLDILASCVAEAFDETVRKRADFRAVAAREVATQVEVAP